MRISVKNCGKVKKADIEFVSGLNVIRGESGSGKSTVLRGIENLVFNSGLDDVITQGENEARLTVEYNNHSVTKIRKPGKSGYIIDGTSLGTVGRLPLQEVMNAFGFKEVKADKTSIRPNFLSQFSYPFLVNESPSKIFEYLTITSNAVNLNGVEDAITSDISELKQSKKSKEDTLNTLKQMILSSSEILKHESEIKNVESLLSSYEKKRTKLNLLEDILTKISKLTTKIDDYNSKIYLLEESLNKIKNLDIDYDKIHSKTSTMCKLEELITRFENTSNRCDRMEEKINNYESNKITIDEDKFSASISRITELQSKIKEFALCKSNCDEIGKQGITLKEENKKISSEIEDFKQNNIPIIVVSTNKELADSLKIGLEEIVDTLSKEVCVAKNI